MIFIKVEVYGRHVKHIYKVETCQKEIEVGGKKKLVFFAKPRLAFDLKCDYEKIGEFEGDNSLLGVSQFYGSNLRFGNENVSIDYRNFRLDTGVLELGITKNLSETDENKVQAEIELDGYIKAFNEDMICSNEHLKKYCEVHKLNPKETDVFSLWGIIYPEDDYSIKNGEIVKFPRLGDLNQTHSVSFPLGTITTITDPYEIAKEIFF